jgi:hypothetical protein
MSQKADGVEIEWSYRPDDRSKQGKRETLPADLARQKVAEGLAVYPRAAREPFVDTAPEDKSTRKAAGAKAVES